MLRNMGRSKTGAQVAWEWWRESWQQVVDLHGAGYAHPHALMAVRLVTCSQEHHLMQKQCAP